MAYLYRWLEDHCESCWWPHQSLGCLLIGWLCPSLTPAQQRNRCLSLLGYAQRLTAFHAHKTSCFYRNQSALVSLRKVNDFHNMVHCQWIVLCLENYFSGSSGSWGYLIFAALITVSSLPCSSSLLFQSHYWKLQVIIISMLCRLN